jgi:integrase
MNRRATGKGFRSAFGHSTIAITLDIYGYLFPRHDDSEELTAAEGALPDQMGKQLILIYNY